MLTLSAAPTAAEVIGDPIMEWDKLIVPSSMTVVVPCWRITELLDQEFFDVARKERLAEKERHSKRTAGPSH
jgi:hypothetical protein